MISKSSKECLFFLYIFFSVVHLHSEIILINYKIGHFCQNVVIDLLHITNDLRTSLKSCSEWYVAKAFQIFCPCYTLKFKILAGDLQIVNAGLIMYIINFAINLLRDSFFHAVFSDVQMLLKSMFAAYCATVKGFL